MCVENVSRILSLKYYLWLIMSAFEKKEKVELIYPISFGKINPTWEVLGVIMS